MKKLVFFVCSLVLMAATSMAQTYDFSADAPSGQTLFYYILDEDEQTVAVVYESDVTPHYTVMPEGDLVIPATVINDEKTYTVTLIEVDAFRGCTGLTSIAIPATVTDVDWRPFFQCENLTTITVDEANPALTAVNNIIYTRDMKRLLACAPGITGAIEIPNTVTQIQNQAFLGCAGITSVTIPASVSRIEHSTFWDCTALEEVVFNEGLSAIDEFAFKDCSKLKTITLPASLTRLGDRVFEGTGWEQQQQNGFLYLSGWLVGWKGSNPSGSLNITYGTKGIADKAVAGCRQLTYISIPASVMYPGLHTVKNCTGISSITIPSSVKNISTEVFMGCTNLSSVTLPSTLNSISSRAFSGCTSLNTFTIPATVTAIYQDILYNTPWYNSQPDGILYKDGWCLGYKGEKPTGSLEFNEGIKGIAGSTFYSCGDLTSVTIPASVQYINGVAFAWYTGLTEVICKATTPPDIDSTTFAESYDKITLYVPASSLDAYKDHQWWGLFATIESIEGGQDAVAEVAATPYKVFSGNRNSLTVQHAQNATITIFDMQGRTIVKEQPIKEDTQTFAMPNRGVYLVKLGATTRKVLVR